MQRRACHSVLQPGAICILPSWAALPLTFIRSDLGAEFHEPALTSLLKCTILECKSPSVAKQIHVSLRKSLKVLDCATHVFLSLAFCCHEELNIWNRKAWEESTAPSTLPPSSIHPSILHSIPHWFKWVYGLSVEISESENTIKTILPLF